MQPISSSGTTEKSSARKTLTRTRTKSQPREIAPSLRLEVKHLEQSNAGEDLQEKIATAAYFRAQERGFAPGYELDDWLTAEQQVRATFTP